MPENDELHISLRRNQNTLTVIGRGVIAFGVWSVLKTLATTVFRPETLRELSEQGVMYIVIFWIMEGLLVGTDLGLRVYVGRSAISEGRYGKRRKGYVALAFLMALGSLGLVALGLWLFGQIDAESYVNLAVGLAVELTSCILLIELGVSAIRVRWIGRKIGKGGA